HRGACPEREVGPPLAAARPGLTTPKTGFDSRGKPRPYRMTYEGCTRSTSLRWPAVLGVIRSQEMERWFILFDLGEAPDRFIEAVIGSVIVHQRDLTHQNAAFLTP